MFRAVWRSFVDLVFSHACPVCKKVTDPGSCLQADICLDCWQSIALNTPPFCSRCGRHLEAADPDTLCADCQDNLPAFDRAFSACVYDGAIKKLIHEFKYARKDYLSKPLGSLLVDFIRNYQLPVGSFDAVLPMPLHPVRLREREFNQAGLLAQRVCDAFGLQLLTTGLSKHRATKSQTDLSPQERRRNVRGAFRVTDDAALRGRRLILIDDVLTTGATASEASTALRGAGADYVLVLTLAS